MPTTKPPPNAPPKGAPPKPPSGNGKPKPTINVPQLTTGKPAEQPPRIILNAVEGFGKTSCAAYAPDAAILMATGETGYLTLLDANRVPDVPRAIIESWPALLSIVDSFVESPPCKNLSLDAMGGFERLCHECVCNRDFSGEWGERGFASYQKGYDLAVTDWLQLLNRLDLLRKKGVNIMFLSHAKTITYKNPLGADYDKIIADVHHKTWAVTQKWADAVLFGNFFTVVETDKSRKAEVLKKGKGIGGTERVIYTERRDAFDAKNRYGMPEVIDIPADPTQIWATINQHLPNGKAG